MGGMLIDDQELSLILDHPVGLKDLADDAEGRPVVLEHDLRFAVVAEICVFEQARLFENSLGSSRFL